MTTFDLRNRAALTPFIAEDGTQRIPFPHEAVMVAALEVAPGPRLLASIQYAKLDEGYLPRRLRALRLNGYLNLDYVRQLSAALERQIGSGSFEITWDQDGLTMFIQMPWAEGFDGRLMTAIEVGGLQLNPGVREGEQRFVKRLFWGHEALDRAGGRKVGSFYYPALASQYAAPWLPGAIAPPMRPID